MLVAALPLFLACAPGPQSRDRPGADLSHRFDVAGDLDVWLWAGPEHVSNPTAMDLDLHGRLWVTEGVNYRTWNEANKGRRRAGGDRVVILADEDGDGACDSSKTFAQDEDLVAPLGICWFEDRVIVSCSPHVFAYYDDDGDDVADRRETLLTGFGGKDHDHGVHSVTAGPDGRLYLAVGNAGPHVVTDRSGWTLRSDSSYGGGGVLTSDDGRVWTGGLVLRMEQDFTGLEVFAHNFRNNYEVAVDAWGRVFTADNDDDGNQSCRMVWCQPAGDHGFFSPDGTRTWRADQRPGQDVPDAHWHAADPGVASTHLVTGAGGPTGVAVCERGLVYEALSGTGPSEDPILLSADAGAGVVYAHRFGAGAETFAHGELLRVSPSARDARWFRPSDVVLGDRGEVFVADWYALNVGGHRAVDDLAAGRILQVGRPTEPGLRGLRFDVPQVQAGLLGSPAPSVRETARRDVVAAGAAGRDALLAHLGTEEAGAGRDGAGSSLGPMRARLLWALADRALTPSDEELLRRARAIPDVGFAARLLERRFGSAVPLDAVAWRGPSPDALFLLRGRSSEEAVPRLVAWARSLEAAPSRRALELFGSAAEGHEAEVYAELAATLGDVPTTWSALFCALVWRLHPPEAVPGWTARGLDESLPRAAREQALEALAFTPGRAAAGAMLTLAQAAPADVRPTALWWVRHRATNDWADYGLLEQLGIAGFEGAEEVWSSAAFASGVHSVDVELGEAEVLWLVVEDGGDGFAYDWANWLDPRLHAGDTAIDLREVAWLEAEAGWGAVHVDKNAGGGELRVDEGPARRGIGTHATSRIAFGVPPGATRFTASVARDLGGSSQGGGAGAKLRFRLLVNRAQDDARWAGLAAVLDDPSAPSAERVRAATELASHPRGAWRVIRAAQRAALGDEVRAAVAPLLADHADLGVRAVAAGLFARPGRANRPELAALLELEGDEERGRALFRDVSHSQCATCHTHAGSGEDVGGDIGPDLTRIGVKYDREALFDAILDPSAGIAFGYETWMIEMHDGEVFCGFVLADGERVVLKDTQGRRYVLEADDIASRTKQTVSTMPAGVASGLTPQELADLVAFLARK